MNFQYQFLFVSLSSDVLYSPDLKSSNFAHIIDCFPLILDPPPPRITRRVAPGTAMRGIWTRAELSQVGGFLKFDFAFLFSFYSALSVLWCEFYHTCVFLFVNWFHCNTQNSNSFNLFITLRLAPISRISRLFLSQQQPVAE
jgi:hypothetical protein